MTSSTSYSTESKMPRGVLIGLRVIVPDPDEAGDIYLRGIYGKPFGVKKPGLQRYPDVLELSLFEALYLSERGEIAVEDLKGRAVDSAELRRICIEMIPEFEEHYRVYRDLRDRGLIVRSGLKFGSDFSLYRSPPGVEHAPYLIGIFKKDEEVDPAELIRAGRLSHSVKKKFIIAVGEGDSIRYASIEWYKP